MSQELVAVLSDLEHDCGSGDMDQAVAQFMVVGKPVLVQPAQREALWGTWIMKRKSLQGTAIPFAMLQEPVVIELHGVRQWHVSVADTRQVKCGK